MDIRPGDRVADLTTGAGVTVKEILGRHATRETAYDEAMRVAGEDHRDAAVVQDGNHFVVVALDEIETLRRTEDARRPLDARAPTLVALASGSRSAGVTLRGRSEGTSALNEVLRTSDGAPVSATGDPQQITTAQIARLDAEAASQGQSPVERALRGIDAGARHLANGQPELAAALYAAEATRLRAHLPPPGADRTLFESLAENLERRVPLYAVQGSRDGMEAAGRLAFTARNTTRLAEMMAKEFPQHASVLKAVGTDSYLQAEGVYAHAAEVDAAFAKSFSSVYQQIVDLSFQVKIEGASGLNNVFTGNKDKMIADRAKMTEVFTHINRLIERDGIPFHRAWSQMFDDGACRAQFKSFPSAHEAAVFLRDHAISRGLLSPMMDVSEGLWEGDAARMDGGRGRLVEALRQADQRGIAERVLEDFQKTAASPDGRSEAQRLVDNQSGERWKARGAAFAEELPILILSGVVSGGAGWGVRAITYGSRLHAAARTAAVVGTELSTFVLTERLLSEAVAGKARDWSAGTLGRDLVIGAAGYGLLRGLARGWQAFRAAAPELGRFGTILRPRAEALHATQQSAARTVASLEETLAARWQVPGVNGRHIAQLKEGAAGLVEEVKSAQRLLQSSPSGAARANLERALAETEQIAQKFRDYAALSPPALPKGRAATPTEMATHQQALAEFRALETRLRQELSSQLAARSEALFAVQAELAGVRARPIGADAGAPMRTDPLLTARQFRAQHGLTPRQNVGVGELSLSGRTTQIGPTATGGGGEAAYTLERTGQYADQARVLAQQPGRHGFPRANDSEVQILEQAAVALRNNPNTTGTLRIFTERPPCASCRRVMSRFLTDHPNIKLEVFYQGTRIPAAVGVGAASAVAGERE